MADNCAGDRSMNLVNEKKLLEEAEKQNISLVTKLIHKWIFSWKKRRFSYQWTGALQTKSDKRVPPFQCAKDFAKF